LIGKPGVGWDHSRGGEPLHAHYPAGAVAPGDEASLAVAASRLARPPAPLVPILGNTLAPMQGNTLKVYDSLVV